MSATARRFYYGWVIVAVAFLAPMLVIGCTVMSFGLFVKPVSAEFQLSRADMNTGFIVLNIGMAVFAPLIGRVADKVRIQLLLPACALLVGGSLIGLGLSESLMVDVLLLGVAVGAGFAGTASLSGFVLIARWFQYKRGRAMSIAAIGQTIGGLAVLPVVASLMGSHGWRQTLIINGVVVIVGVALLSLLVRERPGPNDIEMIDPPVQAARAAAVPVQSVWTIPELLRSRLFWGINVAVAIALAVSQTLTTTLIPLGQERGLTLIQATSLMSTVTISSIAGKLVLAAFADRIEQQVLLAGAFFLLGLLMIALTIDHSYQSLLVCCLVGGLATGTLFPLLSTLIAKAFGSASYGTVMGLKTPLISLLSAAFVRFIGEVYDRTGTYDIAFYSFAVALLVAIAMILSTRTRRDRIPPIGEAVAQA